MSKKSLLGIDLNEVANKAIQDKIQELEQENEELDQTVDELSSENILLKAKLKSIQKKSELVISIFDGFRETYSRIKSDPKQDNDYPRNGTLRLKYEYIKNLMLMVYGIDTEHVMSFGGLPINLAYAFYDYKTELIDILDLIEKEDCSVFGKSVVSFIKDFTMPYDYDKSKILEYVKGPKYNTNNCMTGINALIEYGCIPHDIIQQSPFIADDDVFEELLLSIEKRRGESYMLFQVYKNNSFIDDDKIRKIGEHVTKYIPNNGKQISDYVKNFVQDNLNILSKDVVEELFNNYASDDNMYKLFHWEKFPIEYQYKYLFSKTFSEVLKTTNHYNCKWTDEEKQYFYTQYLNKK